MIWFAVDSVIRLLFSCFKKPVPFAQGRSCMKLRYEERLQAKKKRLKNLLVPAGGLDSLLCSVWLPFSRFKRQSKIGQLLWFICNIRKNPEISLDAGSVLDQVGICIVWNWLSVKCRSQELRSTRVRTTSMNLEMWYIHTGALSCSPSLLDSRFEKKLDWSWIDLLRLPKCAVSTTLK